MTSFITLEFTKNMIVLLGNLDGKLSLVIVVLYLLVEIVAIVVVSPLNFSSLCHRN